MSPFLKFKQRGAFGGRQKHKPGQMKIACTGVSPMDVTLPYPPSTNNLYITVRGGQRILSNEGRAYKRNASLLATSAGVRPLAGDVCVIIDIFRPRKAGDLDNTLKAMLDSLKGIAWIDDKQIKRIIAERFEDKANPRAEIRIESASIMQKRLDFP